jgi:hypothetical protein
MSRRHLPDSGKLQRLCCSGTTNSQRPGASVTVKVAEQEASGLHGSPVSGNKVNGRASTTSRWGLKLCQVCHIRVTTRTGNDKLISPCEESSVDISLRLTGSDGQITRTTDSQCGCIGHGKGSRAGYILITQISGGGEIYCCRPTTSKVEHRIESDRLRLGYNPDWSA